jgi:NitT/TauT family transport system substrate-binding protein
MLKKTLISTFVLSILLSGCSIPNQAITEQTQDLPVSSLQAQPLPSKTVLKVSSAGSFEFMTAVYLADALGEFEQENISIEYVTLVAQEAVPALALDQVDVSGIGITAPFLNAVADGADVRLVLPGPSAPLGDGLWVRTDFLEENDFDSMTIGTGQGRAWLGVVPVDKYLRSQGANVETVEFQQLPLGELATALELGTVDAAWLNSPSHLAFEESGTAKKMAGYSSSEVGSGFAFGPRLLYQEPQVGQAFMRAMLRTITTHLESGYKANPIVVAALAEKLGISEQQLAASAELTFSNRVETKLLTEGQELWIKFGEILSYNTPLSPNEYLDERFVDSIN